jgi:Histidine phosphatase superfamily (branch 2)
MLATYRSQPPCPCAGKAPPLTIYSAHDTTVFSLLSALGATPTAALPDFAAHVVAELWQEAGRRLQGYKAFTVRLMYNDKALQGLVWCPAGSCSLAAFLEGVHASTMSPEDCVRRSRAHPEEACCPQIA